MGWADVKKGPIRDGGGGRFFQWQDGETKVLRILDDEPETVWAHKVSQTTDGEESYKTIPATPDLDENWIQRNSKRWPASPVHNVRAIQIQDGDPVGDIGIVQGGKMIFEPIADHFEQYGTVNDVDFAITRKGTGKNTKWSVQLAKKHAEIPEQDWDSLIDEMNADEALQWDAVFVIPQDGDEQRKMFEDAGFSIDYDPAEDIAAEMDVEEAMRVRMPEKGQGKYPGKSMGELVIIDLGYVQWVAGNYTSDDNIAAAARVVTRNLDEVRKLNPGRKAALKGGDGDRRSAGQRARDERRGNARSVEELEVVDAEDEDGEDQRPAPRTAGRRAAGKAAQPDRGPLVTEINDLLGSLPQYEDAATLTRLVKRHSGGKTRMRDMDVEQLGTMLDDLREEAMQPENPGKQDAKPAKRRAAGRR